MESPEHRIEVEVSAGSTLRWSYRQDGTSGARPLVKSVAGANWPADSVGVQVFAHGEREAMKVLRPILFQAHGLERSQISLSGYWAQGRTEDLFQAEKRQPIGQI